MTLFNFLSGMNFFRQDQEDKGENLTHTGINHVLNLASKIYGSKNS